MTRPCIVVAGMGRCGTSLMMQMLAAGGVPCTGEWPAFESDIALIRRFDAAAFDALGDCAVKLVDPAPLKPGRLPNHVVIWLDRSVPQQARSQIKFLRWNNFPVQETRQTRRAFETGLRTSRMGHRLSLGVPGRTPSIAIAFETILAYPARTARDIAAFLALHGWAALDVAAMAREVVPRSADCYPGMMELELLVARGMA